jgi:acetyl esterase
VDPQLARVVSFMPTLDLGDVAATRALNESTNMPVSDEPGSVIVTHRTVPGPLGAPDVRVRLYSPVGSRGSRAAVLHFHPGLFFGTLDMDHARCLMFASKVGCVVVSVDYRLAPEHRYPAQLDDSYAGLEWIAANAEELDVDPSRVAVAGCSTGATLAAAVALLARDRGGPPVAFQLLLQPALDDRLTSASMTEFAQAGPSEAGRAGSEHIWAHYLGPDAGPVSPYAAPARATDLSGLPAAYVSVNEFDCLRDEGIAYALRLIAAGVPTELHHYQGTFHAFDLIVRTAAISKRALGEQIDVLSRALTPQTPAGPPARSRTIPAPV